MQLIELPNKVWVNPVEVSHIEPLSIEVVLAMNNGETFYFRCRSSPVQSLEEHVAERTAELVSLIQGA